MPAALCPRRRPSHVIEAYLARGPERHPQALLARSVLPLVRAAFLFHGVVARGWSLGWLAGFLFAEFFLLARLAVLGDRFANGFQLDPELHRRTSLVFQLAWLAVSTAALAATGVALAASQAGAPIASLDDLRRTAVDPQVVWGVGLYLVLLFVDALIESFAARREKRPFASAATLQAAFFLVAVLALSFLFIAISGLVDGAFGERGVRGAFALQLVTARSLSELAVLWLPLWAPRLERWKRGAKK